MAQEMGGRIQCGEAGYLGGGFAPARYWRIGCYASPLTQPVRIYQLPSESRQLIVVRRTNEKIRPIASQINSLWQQWA